MRTGASTTCRGWDFVENDALAPSSARPRHTRGGHDRCLGGRRRRRYGSELGHRGHAAEGGTTRTDTFTEAALVDAFNYACTEGADVVNGSFGGNSYSPAIVQRNKLLPRHALRLRRRKRRPRRRGGQRRRRHAYVGHLSVCLPRPHNIVCVAASTEAAGIASFSNFRPVSCSIAAPRERDPEHESSRGGTAPYRAEHVDGFHTRCGC